MEANQRVESALEAALARATTTLCPDQLAAALLHAVFPSGARVRPRLCLAVAKACGDDRPNLVDSVAAAIELVHCASLVHDDMPCFDDADIRRGRPSVHKAFGEPIALLAGDALLVSAFEVLGRTVSSSPDRAGDLIAILAASVGGSGGIIAGQAWECEKHIPLVEYHSAKTGSLFAAATTAGALAGGGEPRDWRTLGERLGEAYQIADDICDTVAADYERGKPAHRDRDLGRPNAVRQLGLDGAIARLKCLLDEGLASIPECPGKDELCKHIEVSAKPYLPKACALVAA